MFESGERCSCCGEPLRMKRKGSEVKPGKCPSPLSQAPSPSPGNVVLPPIRFTEMKFVDAESEVPDDGGALPAMLQENQGRNHLLG